MRGHLVQLVGGLVDPPLGDEVRLGAGGILGGRRGGGVSGGSPLRSAGPSEEPWWRCGWWEGAGEGKRLALAVVTILLPTHR